MNNSLEEALSNFDNALREADLHPKVKEDASRTMRKRVNAFEAEPDNRVEGGGRVRKKPRERTIRTVSQATQAATTIERVTQAATTRQSHPAWKQARDVLKSLRTLRDFCEAEQALSTFVGKRNKASHRQNVREAKKKEITKAINDRLSVRRPGTSESLSSFGQKLKLCVTDKNLHYHDSLRDGTLEFWVLLREGKPLGLLSIDPDEREVVECNGSDHEPIGLDRGTMLEILRVLKASGDNCEAFIEIGAYKLFLDNPDLQPDIVNRREDSYEIWGAHGTVVICKNERHWSQLTWASNEWRDGCLSELSLGELLDVISDCPDLGAAIAKYRGTPHRAGRQPVNGQARRLEHRPRRRRRRRPRRPRW